MGDHEKGAAYTYWEDRPDEQARSVLARCSNAEALKNQTLDLKDLPYVLTALIGVSSEWYSIGTVLRVDDDILSGIRKRNRNAHVCLTDMLGEWLPRVHKKYGPPNMKKVVAAIASSIGGNNPAEALRIAKEYKDTNEILLEALKNTDDETLSQDDKPAVLEVLYQVSHRWCVIGLMFGLPYRTLQGLQEDCPDVSDRLDHMTSSWLSGITTNKKGFGPPSWKKLAETIASRVGGNNEQLAGEIIKAHPRQQTQSDLPSKEKSAHGNGSGGINDMPTDHESKVNSMGRTEPGQQNADSNQPQKSKLEGQTEPGQQNGDSIQLQKSKPEGATPQCNVVLTIKDLAKLQDKLCNVGYAWRKIGLQLGFDPGELEGIGQTADSDPLDKLTLLMQKWLQRVNPPPTLETLCKVIEGGVIGNKALAQKLRQEQNDFPSAQTK